MSQFRPALDAFLDGNTDLPSLQRELKSDLSRDPGLADTLGALIESSYRAGRIGGPAYLDLMQIVRSTTPPALPTLLPHPAADIEETRFRPAQPAANDDAETRYRRATLPDETGTVLAVDPPPPNKKLSEPSRPTGPGWSDPAQWEDSGRALRAGDTIKERFVLEAVIGAGGMGVVFRARDLRKEEAQDRHPHVAIKVLNEDFKRHPESLKALQREARKAQNLAHPNIITVFDFDRDGSNVYMVMELLEGEPLDKHIKRLNAVGMPIAKALPIIRALCSALSYAHEHGVVHSDFKPANAFVTRNGAIKVFDFGIARAAKQHGDDTNFNATGTLTLFDAGTLGALTPAYASCEMIERQDPDPRDDVYALGCVAYELLTGNHPFDRKPATQAREAKLKPKPVQGLNGRQWRGLRRALAFDRTTRTASAAKFLEELSPEKRSPALWIGAAASLAAIGLVTALVLPDYLQDRRNNTIADLIRSGTSESIESALPRIEALPPDVRATMLLDESVRAALIGHFNSRITAATERERQQYDYPRAETLLSELKRLFPDSQAVAEIGERLSSRKNDEIKRQSDRFDQLLRNGWLVQRQNPDNISSVLAIMARIDPRHPLLIDPRLPSAYAEQAQLALDRSDTALAQQLVEAGLLVAGSDTRLKDLNDLVARLIDSQQRAARLAELRDKLSALANAVALSEFDAVHEDLSALQSQEPNNPQLLQTRSQLQSLLDARMQSLAQTGAHGQAQEVLSRYADLAVSDYVERKRQSLVTQRGSASDATQERAIQQLKDSLDALLKAPAADDRWDLEVRRQLARLSAYIPSTDSYVANVRRSAAEAHVTTAAALRSQSRLSEADLSLQRAAAHAPQHAAILDERRQLADVRARQEARDSEQKRLAQLAALKQKLLDQATADEVVEAAASLRELRAGLPQNDAFVTGDAPRAIASAYVRLAAAAAKQNNFDSALTLIERALELDRRNGMALAQRERYLQQTASAKNAAADRSETSVPPAAPAAAVASTGPSAPGGSGSSSAPPSSGADMPAAAAAAAPTSTQIASLPTSQPTAAGNLCTASLAGYGTRTRGVCFDTLPTGRGPELVVVPAGGSMAKPFAISRYEVSTGEYAAFCQQSGKCKAPASQADLPMTSIPANEAQQYVEWLSTASGALYRLPTEAEWAHAANAPGGSAQLDFNCAVEINGQKIRGFALNSVRSGRPNGWGLYNHVGNAQEWVKTAAGWSARGGAFSDPISQCSVASSRASTGAADNLTGFRVVRELL